MGSGPGLVMVRKWFCTDGFSEDNLLNQLIQSSEIGLGVIDERWRYQAVNEKLAAMNGVPAQEHLGKTVREILGPELASRLEPVFEKVFTSGAPLLNLEVNATTLPTQPQRTMLSLFPIIDARGKIIQLAGIVIGLPAERAAAEVSPVLRSWKEIARYLGTCVRTVQRWEQLHGLPVRRVQRANGAAVFATRADVDNWLHSNREYVALR